MRSISARVRRLSRTFCAPGRKIPSSARFSTTFWRSQALPRSAGRLHRSPPPRRGGTSSSFSSTAPPLKQRADPQSFAEHFANAADAGVVVFPNVGGDAVLIAPCPNASPSCYAHLAAFVRGAPEWQQQSLWRTVGEAAAARVGIKPVWLSTAGAGVAWVHVRLDDRPKYYGYDAYRRAPGQTPKEDLKEDS